MVASELGVDGEAATGVGVPFVKFGRLFSPEQCRAIASLISGDVPVYAAVGPAGYQTLDFDLRRVREEKLVPKPETEWLHRRLRAALVRAARIFGLDVTGIDEPAKLLIYEPGCHFQAWHMDCGAGPAACRKVSISVELSDRAAFSGGQLEIFPDIGGEDMETGIGDAVAFPSYRFHRVTPVTAGTRFALVNWISGPPLK